MNAKTQIQYGRRENPVTGQLDGVVIYTEPDSGDEITLLAPPYDRIYAYRNGMPTATTNEMVMIWTNVAGLLGSRGIFGGLR